MTTNSLKSQLFELDDVGDAQEFYHSRGWTDGFPIVPPTPEALQACLDWVLMPANEIIGIEPVREQAITAEKLAINTVMAGWGRKEIANYLFEKARIKRSQWTTVGKGSVVRKKGDTEYCALPSPEHLLLVAAGGPAGGFGAIIPS